MTACFDGGHANLVSSTITTLIVSRRYRDTATYWPKIARFSYRSSIAVWGGGDPAWISWREIRSQKTIQWRGYSMISLVHGLDERETDEQTDGIAIMNIACCIHEWMRRAIKIYDCGRRLFRKSLHRWNFHVSLKFRCNLAFWDLYFVGSKFIF